MYNRRGFTLIELMLIIIIASVLLAIAIPNFEALVYGPSSNRATFKLMGALNEARLKAIKMHQPVTVAFNQPLANQLTMMWNENGINRTKVHRLHRNTTRVTFDNAPPGGALAPDNNFVFTSMGFIQPNLGNPTGNIYVVDNTNGRRFHIATTLAGGIVERQWNGSAWTGPMISFTP
jgi:prepilin-type N-terminal cleavage/methylation domain-containing protein